MGVVSSFVPLTTVAVNPTLTTSGKRSIAALRVRAVCVCVCVSGSRAPTIPVSRGIDEVGQRGAERKRGWVRSRRAGTQLASALNMSYVVQPVSQRSVWLAGRERSSGH